MILRYFVVAICWLFVTLNVGVNASEHVRKDLSIADIPACGLQCLFRNMPKNSCKLDDFECICNQRETIQAVSSCMVNNCTMADNLATARVNRQLCNLSDESKSGEIITYTTVVYAVAFTCVALRIAGKLVSRKLAWNDVPIVVAVILTTLPIALIYTMTMLGFGEHIWNLEDGRLLPILRYFYICRSSYIIILGLIKISLVLFYLEIFTSRRFRQISWAIFGYIAVHSIVIFILTIVPCTPVEAFWDRDLLLGSGKCMDIQIVSYTNSVSSILQDLMLMFLPMFFIKNLQMKRHRKLALVSMFSLGGFGCIATLIRLHTLLKFKISFDPTWDYSSIVIWTELEITAAFVCVSLPSIRVLVMRFIPWTSSDWRPNTSRHTNNKSSKNGEKHQPGMAAPPPEGWKQAVTWTTITSNEAGIAKPKKSLSVTSRTPIIPHSQYARRAESARSNHSDTQAAVERSPFHEPGPITIPESKFAIKESSVKKYAHRQSRNSRGLYDGTDITALPSIGCLPERTFSKERIDRK